MNITRQQYIDHHYDIVWQHPDAKESDWNIFLLEEIHDEEIIREVNGLFISLFSPKGSVFATESQDFLKTSNTPLSTLDRHHIATPNIPPENVVGWDYSASDFVGHIKTAHKIERDILSELLKDEGHLNSIDWNSFDWKEEIANKWLESSEKTNIVIINNPDLRLKYIEYAINKTTREMEDFCKREIVPLQDIYLRAKKREENKLIKEFEQCDIGLSQVLKNALNSSDKSQLRLTLRNYVNAHPEACDEVQVLVNKYKDFAQSYSSVQFTDVVVKKIRSKILSIIKEDYTSMIKRFPLRTQAMLTTLQNIESLITSDNGVVNLVAGVRHLEEDPKNPEEEKQDLSLKPLYDYLKEHKNIVILRPKRLILN